MNRKRRGGFVDWQLPLTFVMMGAFSLLLAFPVAWIKGKFPGFMVTDGLLLIVLGIVQLLWFRLGR